ncbi:hypothetical protein I2H31_04730 [Hymenobacter sp. BT662]|uniref:TonB C-terminal domain-containing protein n=1 Tax=Hymenobacter ruricola TaxID=2791023 RepID=A0ABS0I0U7_9BACT|nr:hypothetical protein [Hymenobacter ruricola]
MVWLLALPTALPAPAQARSGRRPARKAAALPAPVVGTAPLLPRFWLLTDSVERAESAAVFTQYLQHFITYPASALRAGVGGVIYALLTVLPDGRVGGISITRRDLSAGSPPIKAVLALDAELQRVAWQLRFKALALRPDSTAAAPSTSIVRDVTDHPESTATMESGDALDVTDVTDNAEAAHAPVDTVTVYYRFAPQ